MDIDLLSWTRLQNAAPANLDYLQADIVAGPVDPGTFDLVTARAVLLYDVADVDTVMTNLVASLAPGGAILLIEPDFLPVSIAEPAEVHPVLGWLAAMVPGAGHRLLPRPHACASVGRARHR